MDTSLFFFEMEKIIGTEVMTLILLKITEGQTMMDFDSDFCGRLPFGLMQMDLVELGVETGILDKYEDELYYIDDNAWKAVYIEMQWEYSGQLQG